MKPTRSSLCLGIAVIITWLALWPAAISAKDGRLELKLDLAANDSPGVWQIRVRKLASGQTASHYVRVSRP